MKTNLLLATLACAAIPAFAGPPAPASKAVVPPPPVYGTGWYGAIQAGVNAYQDLDTNDVSFNNFRFSFDADSNVGAFVGGKFGYVFGTGKVRPAVELDAFYNHFDIDVDVHGSHGGKGNLGGDVDSGAFLANFLLRFDFGRFQPYLGGGVGVHYSELSDGTLSANGRTYHGDGGSTTDFAWQLIGGADYYFTEKFSIFLEYKWLNYEGCGNAALDDRIGQHLVGAGVRVHF